MGFILRILHFCKVFIAQHIHMNNSGQLKALLEYLNAVYFKEQVYTPECIMQILGQIETTAVPFRDGTLSK